MDLDSLLGACIALVLFAYLIYALVRAEKF